MAPRCGPKRRATGCSISPGLDQRLDALKEAVAGDAAGQVVQ